MQRLLIFLCVLSLFGCVAPSKSTSHELSYDLPPSGLVFLKLPSTGESEEDPAMLIEVNIVDEVTKNPVSADVFVVISEEFREPIAGEQMLQPAQYATIRLPPQLNAWLLVRAPGYAEWKIRMNYFVKTTRKLTGDVRLTPVGNAQMA